VRDGRLHRLGALQHERQLHLPAAEQFADDFHAVQQNVVDDGQRRIFLQASSRWTMRSRFSPSMMCA
jgi:hypothetical protein